MTADALRDRIAQALHHEGAYCGNCGYENDIEDCPDCELILYGYARAIERLLADADPTDLGMKASGVWYCRRHAGTANEDDPRGLCPWWEHADHCDAEHDEGLDDGACSPCEWIELLIPPAHPAPRRPPMAKHSEDFQAVRERIADRLFGQMHGQGITSPLLLADAVLDALGLEQVGWMVWEDPQDSDSWIAVGLDDEDLIHSPHRPLYTAIPPSLPGSSDQGGVDG